MCTAIAIRYRFCDCLVEQDLPCPRGKSCLSPSQTQSQGQSPSQGKDKGYSQHPSTMEIIEQGTSCQECSRARKRSYKLLEKWACQFDELVREEADEEEGEEEFVSARAEQESESDSEYEKVEGSDIDMEMTDSEERVKFDIAKLLEPVYAADLLRNKRERVIGRLNWLMQVHGLEIVDGEFVSMDVDEDDEDEDF